MRKNFIYRQITVAWGLIKQFIDRPERDERFWDDFAEALKQPEIVELAKTPFGLDLLHAVQLELERGGHG